MEYSTLAATLTAAAVLVAVAGKKFALPDWTEAGDKTEEILKRTGGRFSNLENRTLLKKVIMQAGLDIEPEYFIGLQIALPIVCVICFLPFVLIGLVDIFWPLLVGIILYFIPRVWLNNKARQRVESINRDIPAFCVSFAAVLESGADFYTAITEVSNSMKDSELAKEFSRAIDEMSLGKRRSDALADIAIRCSIPDLTDLVRRMDQAERYGTSMADAIKDHAQRIMIRRKNDAAEKAGRLTIRLLPIILIFILGPLMGLLFFPVFYHLLQAF
ncbi:type II secretion system F family protein [Desulfofalx alkaliphila]|uniref:type II secretion system F family protein n=1 Tax=Desulfofalx alkaliphila TaxID=105483 RepID=UPI0004E1C8B5|nr:type II secretion system F family protein [Desulfofalx alkaliphila]